MRLLCFQARRFRWKTHSKTLAEAPDREVDEEVGDSVVVFIHAERSDEDEARAPSVLRQAVKHVKWLANKKSIKSVVLHSFTHLGGDTASAPFAQSVIATLARRLKDSGYQTRTTPFGYSCEWDLDVYGEGLAKVWKEIQ